MDFQAGKVNDNAWIGALQIAELCNNVQTLRDAVVLIGEANKWLKVRG